MSKTVKNIAFVSLKADRLIGPSPKTLPGSLDLTRSAEDEPGTSRPRLRPPPYHDVLEALRVDS